MLSLGALFLSSALPFLVDDYDAARAAALRQKRPLFVEVWAAW
jgi:hypothetical protein